MNQLELFLSSLGVSSIKEFRFAPPRRWRFDYAFPHMTPPTAIEIEGGTWVKGRHIRPKGYEADCEKYNEAALLGWRVLRFTTDMIRDGRAMKTIERILDTLDPNKVLVRYVKGKPIKPMPMEDT